MDRMPLTDLVFFTFTRVAMNLEHMLRNQMQHLQHKSEEGDTLSQAYSILSQAQRNASGYHISEALLHQQIASACTPAAAAKTAPQTGNLNYDLNELQAISHEIKQDLEDGQLDDKQDANYLQQTLQNVSHSSTAAKQSQPEPPQSRDCQMTVSELLQQYDITIQAGTVSPSRYDEIMQKIQEKQSSLNTTTRMEMTQMQDLNHKYNKAFEACSNLMKTNFQSLSAIMRNM